MAKPTAAYRRARRDLIDARAQRTLPLGPAGTDLRGRTQTETKPLPGPVRRSRATRLTATMRRGDGSVRSAWTRSPHYWTDPKWSRTVSG